MMRRAAYALTLALVVAATGALAQSISTFVGSSATNYALDGQGTTSAAFDLRRLLTSYTTNKLVNIRRASDNATADIGFTATGAIDTATASTHCNATTCFVATWYDQSGNGRDIVQATTGNQPAFIFTCLNNYPCIQTTAATQTLNSAGNLTPATGVASFSVVAMRTAGSGTCAWLRENGANNRVGANNSAGAWILTGGTSGTITATAANASWHAAQAVINGASSVVNIDGTETTGTATGNTTAGTVTFAGTGTSTCNIVSAITWDNVALSAAQRTMLNANQHAWWGF